MNSLVQNEETTTDYYGKMWRDIRHTISYMPEEMKQMTILSLAKANKSEL